MTTHLVWFRNDLRITDNAALDAACQDPQARTIAVYLATPQQWQEHDMAPRQAALIHASLTQLQQALAGKGIALHYHQCADFNASVDWLVDFCRRQQVTRLFYNRQYELNERRRDRRLVERLASAVDCQGFDDGVLLAPGSVVTGKGEMYKVFTPFRQACLRHLQQLDIRCRPAPAARGSAPLTDLPALTPFSYPQLPPGADFPPGEQEALQRLRRFCREQVMRYHQDRDLPALSATSQLSPYLAIGAISVRQCFCRLLAECPDVLERREGGAFTWLNELLWREFYRHLLVAWPALCRHRPFIGWTDRVRWSGSQQDLLAWQRGETGYPIVDAGMRQMNQTGWMHNRLRMICASFLVKDLLIDWRAGERYFMSQLLDGDLAANNGGWQWSASTGTDAAPWFRIFNPQTQGERFDPQGEFIRRWLPELAAIPGAEIHQPQRWAERRQQRLDYPVPIVDHRLARQNTLAAFEAAKGAPAGDNE
ncbi:deoxyribodipyrimidine photo-lyase [Affinibrenneria salicis]|uniref:Deoxyribodipyrimidine photo-lyase n=1 Tax=Affinibrenneria salicis TaxID=2590031 RepID=A0A5J5G220_9GAMM|nr:deoxyribodipyrimidine photo-lyase [Affinibrenneria salicis]KAA8999917.1 deoxyribodipyrimidine photo-lyase [Affinibrenneria salicis]